MGFHPRAHRRGRRVGCFRLQGAALGRHHIMAAGPIKPEHRNAVSLGNIIDRLVAVSQNGVCRYNLRGFNLESAYPSECVVYPGQLHFQLFPVAHMHQAAASAPAEQGTARLGPLWRSAEAGLAPGVYRRLAGLNYAQPPGFAGQRALDEYGPSVYPAHAKSFGGKTFDCSFINLIFININHSNNFTIHDY